MSGAVQAAPPVTIQTLPSPEKPVAYGVSEWRIDPGQVYQNPYDPAEVAIDAVFE